MSRRTEKLKKKQQQSAAPAPTHQGNQAPPVVPATPVKPKRGLVFVPPAKEESDDELFCLAQTMKVNHRKFADGILQGMSGTEASAFSGYTGDHPRKQSSYLMRRPDVVRYIRLMQGRTYGESVVTLKMMVDRLWAIITDPNASSRQKELSWGHLVKIRTAESRIPLQDEPPKVQATPEEAGLAEVDRVLLDLQTRKGPEIKEPDDPGEET
jgi:hypothetical protein